MQRNKTLFKKIFQRKKVLGFSISIFLFFIFLFSTITTFIIYEYFDVRNNPIDGIGRNIYWGDYYEDGNIEKHVEEYREYIKNKFDLDHEDFNTYKVPSYTTIEIQITDAFDFDEQTSSIYAKGFVSASWDRNAVQNYQEKSKVNYLHDQTKKDILSTSYLNFYDSENQIYKNIFLDNTSQNKISKYEFSGRFRLERNLSKFPFDQLRFNVALISLMDARDVNFINSDNYSFTDDKYRFEAFVNKQTLCYAKEDYEADENGYLNYEEEKEWDCKYNELRPIFYNSLDHSNISTKEFKNKHIYGYVPYITNVVHFRRAYSSSFFRYILPLIVGITVLFLTDYLSDKFREFKLATPPTVLLTFIFMQNGYQAEIPQISYITFIDKLYYLSYFAAILQLSSTLIGINSRNRFTRKLKKKSYLDLRIIFRFIFLISTIFLPFVMYFTS